MTLFKETPADLIAANSYFSDKFPKAMMDDNKIPIGRAVGVSINARYARNFKIKNTSIPLPAISSKANQRACITKTKRTTKNVAKKGCKKLFKIYLSNIFKITSLVQK